MAGSGLFLKERVLLELAIHQRSRLETRFCGNLCIQAVTFSIPTRL
jgi:hypothetical protein